MNQAASDRMPLGVKAIVRFVMGFVLISALMFIPAGTFRWWQAWLFLGSLFGPMSVVFGYLWRHDPDLLERRMRSGEREPDQAFVVRLGSMLYLLIFVLPGLDRRFGWSQADGLASWVAAGVFIVAYGFFFLVLRANSHASRVVEVEAGQKLATSGPYALVRHPMYTAILVMMLMVPVVLGSWWSAPLGLGLVPIFVVRIRGEERLLERELPGYREYARKTRFRLVPGVW